MGDLYCRFCVTVLATHATRVISIFGNLRSLLFTKQKYNESKRANGNTFTLGGMG